MIDNETGISLSYTGKEPLPDGTYQDTTPAGGCNFLWTRDLEWGRNGMPSLPTSQS